MMNKDHRSLSGAGIVMAAVASLMVGSCIRQLTRGTDYATDVREVYRLVNKFGVSNKLSFLGSPYEVTTLQMKGKGIEYFFSAHKTSYRDVYYLDLRMKTSEGILFISDFKADGLEGKCFFDLPHMSSDEARVNGKTYVWEFKNEIIESYKNAIGFAKKELQGIEKEMQSASDSIREQRLKLHSEN